jgi:hypothetical protein
MQHALIKKPLTEKYFPFALVGVWCILQFILLWHFGIVTKGESVKYIEEARFVDGHGYFSEPKYLFYSGYIALHWIFFKTGAGIIGVYIFQLFWNGLSMICFYQLSRHLSGHKGIAGTSTVLLLLFWPYQSWTTHLYTESFFTSTIIIALHHWFYVKKSRTSTWTSIGLMALLILSRPTGMLFIPVWVLILSRRMLLKQQWVKLGIAIVVSSAFFICIANTAMQGKGEFDFMKPFVEEHIICGVPTQRNMQIILPENGNSLGGLSYYITHNMATFLTLCGRKFYAFWSMTRDHYSFSHNVFLIFFLYPVYLFLILSTGFWLQTQKEFYFFSLLLVSTFLCSVLLTCDDWLNRFIMPLIPVLFLLGAPGYYRFIRRLALKWEDIRRE